MRTSQSSLNTHSNKLTGLNRAKTPVRTGVSPLIRHFLLIFALLCLFAAHRILVPTPASQSFLASTEFFGSSERSESSITFHRADWIGDILDLIDEIVNDEGELADDDDSDNEDDDDSGDDGDGEGEEGGSEPGKE